MNTYARKSTRSPTAFRKMAAPASEFQTLDMGLVAALVHIGYPLKRIVPITDRKKVTFFFEDGEDLQEAIAAYHDGSLQVEARKYFDDLKALKTRIHDTIDNSYEN